MPSNAKRLYCLDALVAQVLAARVAAVLWLKRSGRGSGALDSDPNEAPLECRGSTRPEQTRHDTLGCDHVF